MIRVLQVVTHMNRGGLETMLMNYYRYIDRNRVQFDFLTHRSYDGDYGEEIAAMGGKIYHLPALNPLSFHYRKELSLFFKTHPEYSIVHVHQDCMSAIILRKAQESGVPCRIAHSHGASQRKDMKYPIKQFYKHLIHKYATELIACSDSAGQWMFCSAPYILLNNAIDTERFIYDKAKRSEIRKALGLLDNQIVIGHVGNITTPKNHRFIIEIFVEVLKKQPHSILLLVGDDKGTEGRAIHSLVKEKNIVQSVIFAGVRDDIADLLQAMDVFLFPSLWEGLSLATIEAQASGLPLLISDQVSIECKKTDLVHVLSLKDSPSKWANEVLRLYNNTKRSDTTQQIRDAGFDIKESAKKLEAYYIEKANCEA